MMDAVEFLTTRSIMEDFMTGLFVLEDGMCVFIKVVIMCPEMKHWATSGLIE